MKLKTKLALTFSLLLTLLLITLSYSAYTYTRSILTERIEAEIQAQTDTQVNKLNGWLVSKAKMLEMTAGTLQKTTAQTEVTVPMVAGFEIADAEISDLYLGLSSNGAIIDGKGWIAPADFDSRTRSWYKDAIAAGKLTYGEPYLDKVTNKMALPIAMPLKDAAGGLRGVLSEDILMQTMIDTVKAIHSYDGYAFLIDTKGNLLVHPNQDYMGKNLTAIDELKEQSSLWQEMLSQGTGLRHTEIKGQTTLMAYEKIPASGWILAIHIPMDNAYKPLSALRWIFTVGTILSIILVTIVTFFISRKITRPIEILSRQVDQMAGGDLTVHIEQTSEDELGLLGQAFNKMANDLRTLIHKVQIQSQQLAASSEELTASSDQSAQSAEQVTEFISVVADQSSRQNEAANQMTGVIGIAASRIEKISQNTELVSRQSEETKEQAAASGKMLDKAVLQMQQIEQTVNTSSGVVSKLSERSSEIGQIVETISAIAGQTNLLALNAAIEAARAGEQGRGFAVVAEEVRKLAEQSQEATRKITDLISSIQSDTAEAVTAMESGTREVRTGTETVTQAGQSFQQISDKLSQQASQTREISQAIRHIDQDVQDIVHIVKNVDEFSKKSSGSIQQISASTEEQLASTEEIAKASAALAELAQELQMMIAAFKV